jgi:hypothetical protein
MEHDGRCGRCLLTATSTVCKSQNECLFIWYQLRLSVSLTPQVVVTLKCQCQAQFSGRGDVPHGNLLLRAVWITGTIVGSLEW